MDVLELKIKNPIVLLLSNGKDLILGEGKYEDLPLIPGSMFGGENYGFVLIVNKNGIQSEELYPTQCRIISAGIEQGYLRIGEENKYVAWRFDLNGKIVEPSRFLNIWRRDVNFLADLGVVGEENIAEINRRAYQKGARK